MNKTCKIIITILSIIIVALVIALIKLGYEYNHLFNYSLEAGKQIFKRQVAVEESGYKFDVNEDGSYKLVKEENDTETTDN